MEAQLDFLAICSSHTSKSKSILFRRQFCLITKLKAGMHLHDECQAKKKKKKKMDIIKFQHQENDNVKCVCYKDNKKKSYVEYALNSKKKHIYTKVTSNPSWKLGGL